MKLSKWASLALLSLLVCGAALAQQPAGEPEKEKNQELKPPTKKEIDEAVKKGVKWLLERQKENGSFEGTYSSSYPMGNTALCLLALLKSGVKRTHPSIRRGFAYAMGLPLKKVYSVSIMILALEAYHEPTPKEMKKNRKLSRTTAVDRLGKRVGRKTRRWVMGAVEWLIKQQQKNIWRYPTGGEDVSNTQYALLALNAAMRMKVKVPPSAFKKAADYFLQYQGESKEEFKPTFRVPAADLSVEQLREMEKEHHKRLAGVSQKPESGVEPERGPKTEVVRDPYRRYGVEEKAVKMYPRGWNYTAPRPPQQGRPPSPVRGTGSMTAAGVASLVICKAGLEGTRLWSKDYAKKVNQAIRDGAAWLAKYFTVEGNPYGGSASSRPSSSWHYYYLYGLERAGVLALVKKFGEHDWYVEGARYILKEQEPEGWWGKGISTVKSSRGTQKRINPCDTCFALLFLKRGTTPIVGVPEEMVIYSGKGILKKEKPEGEAAKKEEKEKPRQEKPSQAASPGGWKIGAVVEFTIIGVRVRQVAAGYPAKGAGLKDGDFIESVNGKEVKTLEEFRAALREATGKADEVRLGIRRGADKLQVTIKKR